MKNKLILKIFISVVFIFVIVLLFYVNNNTSKNINSNKPESSEKINKKISLKTDKIKPAKTNEIVKKDLFFRTYKSQLNYTGQYHLYEDMKLNKNTGIMIYFHGDNANDFNKGKNSKRLNLLVDVSKEHNLIPIALKTPTKDLTWWKNIESNSEYINDFFINFILKKYDINKNRVLLVGYSGGAELLSEYFIYKYGQYILNGGAILFAGGSKPPINDILFNDKFVSDFNIHFYSGTNDFMHSDVLYGVEYFMKKGFATTYEYPEGEDHYNLPFYKIVNEQLENGFLK
ncbi:MAG: hypothetical protein ABF289_05855 [Clostridiales bacterium]